MNDYDQFDEEPIKVPKFEEAMGFYTSSERSQHMSRIRGKNSKPEIKLRKALWSAGIRYRIHPPAIPGKPDIYMHKHKLAIFVDGTFWHGYKWEERKKNIKSNRKFWIPKIERNRQRDREVNFLLKKRGITVMRFWEFEVNKNIGSVLYQIIQHIEHSKYYGNAL